MSDKKEILKVLDSLGVRTSAFKILCFLTFHKGELKPSEISERLGMKAGTVRARLTELKGAGLVQARRDGYVSNLLPYDILMRLYDELRREMREEMKDE